MAGIFEAVAGKLITSAGGQADKWVDKGVEVVALKAATSLPTEVRPVADAVIDILNSDKDTLHEITHRGFTEITMSLAVGAEDDAYLTFLREHATHEERQDALLGAMRASVGAKVSRDETWAKTKKIALDVLLAAGKAAIPLLLAMV